jgi:hypothetical protein
MWLDLYTLAVRVETLGHGIYANRGYEPTFKGPPLADALVRVLKDRPGEEGYDIKMKAEEIAKACQATKGDETAVDTIVKAATRRDGEIAFTRKWASPRK